MFVLSKLGHVDLATMLVDQLLADKKVGGGSAELVIRQALNSKDDDLVNTAALIVQRRSRQLASPPDGIYWPVGKIWNSELSAQAKRYLLRGLIEILVSSSKWDRGIPVMVIGVLWNVWKNDSDDSITQTAAYYLKALTMVIEQYETLFVPDGRNPKVACFRPPDDQSFDRVPTRDRELAKEVRCMATEYWRVGLDGE